MPSPIHILAIETSTSTCDLALLTQLEGDTTVRCLSFEGSTQHAERLLPLVAQLLDEAGIRRSDLSAIAFGQGPGGFTGLRVACGVAQGLAFSLGIGVIPVGSLAAVAHMESGNEEFRVVLQDARMSEVYLAAYQRVAVTPAGHMSDDGSGAVSVGSCSTDGGQWHEIQQPVLLAIDAVADWLAGQVQGWQSGSKTLAITVAGDALSVWPDIVDKLTKSCLALSCDVKWRRGQPARPAASRVARMALSRFLQGQIHSPFEVAPLYVRDKVAFTVAERQQGKGGNPAAAVPATIRPMTEADIEQVLAIEASVQAFPWTRGNFSDALKAGYPAWVIAETDHIVGFYVAHYVPDLAHLLLIGVDPDRQRQGLGHRLLQHFEAQSALLGVGCLSLEVRQSNQKAINFYQNRGFSAVGIRKNYYRKNRDEREDASVMEKTLQDAGQRDG